MRVADWSFDGTIDEALKPFRPLLRARRGAGVCLSGLSYVGVPYVFGLKTAHLTCTVQYVALEITEFSLGTDPTMLETTLAELGQLGMALLAKTQRPCLERTCAGYHVLFVDGGRGPRIQTVDVCDGCSQWTWSGMLLCMPLVHFKKSNVSSLKVFVAHTPHQFRQKSSLEFLNF